MVQATSLTSVAEDTGSIFNREFEVRKFGSTFACV